MTQVREARSDMRRSGGPFDPRLLRYARVTRRFLVLSVVLGAVTAGLLVAQAWLIADTVAAGLIDHRAARQVAFPLAILAGVVVGRAVVGWTTEWAAQRTSARAKSDLRTAFVERVAELGPAAIEPGRTGETAMLATRGIDALDGYFSRYLPQMFLAVIVPLTVLTAVVGVDWISALVIAVTVPLIPVFMSLVGASTRTRTARQLQVLERLAGHFLDVVAGLPTLKVFGRARAQAATIARVSDRYRRSVMGTLRVAFLSSLILELLATVAVALVAVAVGLRLLDGHLDLRTALFVLVLAPEAYLPLRQLAANYHASSEGMRAAEEVFAVIERPLPGITIHTAVCPPAGAPIALDALSVTYPGRVRPALPPLTFTIEPGEILAVTGPSGCGKSTLLQVLAGLVSPTSGRVRVGSVDLARVEPDAWRSTLAWVPQHPHLFASTLADNIRLSRPEATDAEIRQAIDAAGLSEVVDALPDGLAIRLGVGGAGLSHGERQRVALARAFLRDSPLLLLDEPTTGLDGETEAAVLTSLAALVRGRTVVMAAHRRSLLTIADRVLALDELAPAAGGRDFVATGNRTLVGGAVP